jgi:hypothetical protein
MIGQATPSSTWIWISKDINWEGSTRRLDDVATCLNATQCSRIFWVSFTDSKRSDSVDPPDARSSRPYAFLFWKEYRYSGKVVAEDHPEAVK